MSVQKKLPNALPVTKDVSLPGRKSVDPAVAAQRGPSGHKKQANEHDDRLLQLGDAEPSLFEHASDKDGPTEPLTTTSAPTFGTLAAATDGVMTDVQSGSALQLSQLNLPTAPGSATITAAPAAASGMGMSSIFGALSIMGLAGGGGGAGKSSAGIKEVPFTTQIGGTLINGYIENATVFQDNDGDGILDPDEPSTKTNGQGKYTLKVTPNGGPLVALSNADTVDKSTNAHVTSTFKAPLDATVISPISTLVQAGLTQAQIKTAFGIAAGIDLLSFNPITASLLADDPTAALQYKAASVMVSNMMDVGSSLIGGATNSSSNFSDLVVSGIKKLIVDNTGHAVDLANTDNVKSVLTQSMTLASATPNAQLLQTISAKVASANNAVNAAVEAASSSGDARTALMQIAKIEQVTQTTLADGVNAAVKGNTQSLNAFDLDAAVTQATVPVIPAIFKGLSFDEIVAPKATGQAGGTATNYAQSDDNHVIQFVKGAGAGGQYAHVTLATGEKSGLQTVDPIALAAGDAKLGMWVHTAQAGTKVRVQVGDSASGGYPNDQNWVEVEATTTKAGWDYLTFDFDHPAARFVENGGVNGNKGYTATIKLNSGVTYDMASVFFDLGVQKFSAETYYFDNLTPLSLKSSTPPAAIAFTAPNVIPDGYELVLHDEFDSASTPTAPGSMWKLETGAGGWGNGESQTYDNGLDDAFLQNGSLHIIAKNTGGTITSARLKSQLGDTLDPYGYMEVSAKLPAQTGAWPAIWLLGQSEWPRTGEIDIAEWSAKYFNAQQIQGALHFYGDNNVSYKSYGDTQFKAATSLADTVEKFHTYQLWWTPDYIRIGVDGNINTAYFQYNKPANATANNWPYSNPMDIILNLAIGGTLGGDLPTGNFQYEMVVDYVRVYQGLERGPTTAPTAPTAAAADVVSLYSDAYTTTGGFDIPNWGQSKMVSDTTIASNKVLKGDAFTYQGFQFDAVNATSKSLGKLHLDIWSKDATPVKVYVISAGQDSEFVTVTPTAGAWKAVDIDLSAFSKIDKANIIQVKLDTAIQPTTKEMYFDNIYFGKADAPVVPAAPTTAPTAPTAAAADVVSLYSDAYTTTGGFDIPNWGQSKMVSDTTIASNKVLKGDAFTYQGFQFDAVNATSKSLGKLHLDIWSKDATPVKVYVISAGQDSEFVTVTPTAGAWKAVDIDLSAFSKIDKANIIQVKLDTAIQPTTKEMYFDNIYFGKADAPVVPAAPTTAPTAPTADAADVVSLFSDTYTNVAVDTWSAGWDQADQSSSQLSGNSVLNYSNLSYAGIEFKSHTIDVSTMTHLHLDIWKQNPDSVFKLKLVDFGANGTYGGGDDVEHELTFNAVGKPSLAGNQWTSLEINLSDLTGLTTNHHLAQMVISGAGAGDSVWLDNIYFHNTRVI